MDGKIQIWKRSKDSEGRKGGKGYMMPLKLIGITLGQHQYGLVDCRLLVGSVTLAQCYRANVGPVTKTTFSRPSLLSLSQRRASFPPLAGKVINSLMTVRCVCLFR